MIKLKEGTRLYEISEFHFVGVENDIIPIRVHKAIFGDPPHEVLAIPITPTHLLAAKLEYHGTGETKEEALQDCLNRIMDVDMHDIFE